LRAQVDAATRPESQSSGRRPVIGIACYVETASWGAWTLPAALVPLKYVESVAQAGGRPVVLPPMEGAAEETLDALDGLLLPGGADVDPDLYGAAPHPQTDGLRPVRDSFEMELITEAFERRLPVLGICRGMELMNVARGGDLIQHLPDHGSGETHRARPGEFCEHDVAIDPGSRVGAVLGGNAHVMSHHHQAPGRVGDGLVEVAWADNSVVEAVEDPHTPFTVGVLWHPEQSEDDPLFRRLVDEAQVFAAKRSHPSRATRGVETWAR
jgi:putative glutamine amidotransferase